MPTLAIIAVAAATVALLAALGVLIFLRVSLPKTQGQLTLPGLAGQVEILRDRWGVPHVYAHSAEDLFTAQGYVHAQDRLWQMELQRRAGSGRLSEITGRATLEMDRFFRGVGLNRAAAAELAALDGETLRTLECYAAGVNAYVSSQKGRLPVEFRLLGLTPEPWQPLDSLILAKTMAWSLSRNWDSELLRARLAVRLGAERAADLEPAYPADNPPTVHGAGLREGSPPPNGWGSWAVREAMQAVQGLFSTATPGAPVSVPAGAVPAAGGSNQWVVAGSRSATGAPLLSNDTHLSLSMPAGWYLVHLEGGEYHVTGTSFPGLPGVVVGHNQRCAWGLTTAWQDAQDLYIEKLNPENPYQVEYQGRWVQAEVICEEIRVKGQAEPVIQEVVVTRHGPIISPLLGEKTPLALRWVALEPSNLLGSALRYCRAGNWDEFRAALGSWSTPAHNFIYADVEGNIGFLQAGWVPIRAKGYGLVPVPGWTGEYEWLGYLPLGDLPQAYNPDSGWLATSNHLVVDAAYPHFLSADLENPCRARRVADLISPRAHLSVDDLAAFQLDTYSAPAERMTRHLLTLSPGNDEERRALDHLRTWDHRMEKDSVAASLYQVCRLRALHVVFDGHLGDLAEAYVGAQGLSPLDYSSPYRDRSIVRLLDLLDGQGDDSWLRDPASDRLRSREEVLRQALREALDLLRAHLGQDMGLWTWGRLNRVLLAHPMGAIKPLNLLLNRGPYPVAGDQDTLQRALGRPRFPFDPVAVGDAVRFIADTSDWEQSRIVIPGGQSGQPGSRHYADLMRLWRAGRQQPMPFGRDRVEQAARRRLTLLPG